jgi:bifunctional protein TilS/HprT
MMLLDLFVKNIIPTKGIIVAHMNHMLRESARRDQFIVQDYCQKNNLTCIVQEVDIIKMATKTKTTQEECGRNCRKDFFETLRIKHHADFIVTAHHADDQAETLLYRIIK